MPRRRMRRSCAQVTLIAAVAALVAAGGAQARTADGDWFSYERPATYDSLTTAIQVPTRDGTKLGCDFYRPATDGAPAPGAFPGIVTNYWPYGRRPSAAAVFLAKRGYAVLSCSVRGTFDSEGAFGGFSAPIQVRDNYDLIEWMAAQPWSTGRIGQEGISYGGVTSVEAASANPPHLVAIVPQLVPASFYRAYFYPGGIKTASNNLLVAHGAQANGGVTPDEQIAIWSSHTLLDDYWHGLDLENKLGSIDVPVLTIGGWFDIFREGGVPFHDTLERRRSWLVYGPYEHTNVFDDGTPGQANRLSLGTLLAWWDRWLMGNRRAPLPPARVLSFEMPDVGSRGWRAFDGFPPPGARTARLSLRSDQSLGANAGREGALSYRVDAADGPAAICYQLCDPRADQSAQDAGRLTFTTHPLHEDLVVAGPATLHLRAALSAADGNFVAKLMDVSPSGSVHEATVGYLKASHRESHRYEVPVTPGRVTEYVLTTEPTHWRFRRGHRLRLSVTSGDTGRIVGDAPPGWVTVAAGRSGSFVELSVMRRAGH